MHLDTQSRGVFSQAVGRILKIKVSFKWEMLSFEPHHGLNTIRKLNLPTLLTDSPVSETGWQKTKKTVFLPKYCGFWDLLEIKKIFSKISIFLIDRSYICRISYSDECKRRPIMTKRKLRAMSPAETEILRLVWQLEEATVQQICDLLPPKRNIVYKTVQTLLRRLENKGYLKHKIRGKAHVFFPAVKREDVVKRTVLDFLDRLFGGDPKPLMQFLAEDGHIDAEDVAKLKKLIDNS